MTHGQEAITIILMVLATVLTRFVPFLIFSSDKPTPAFIQYLGKALPAALFGLLIVFCLKDVKFATGVHGAPEIIAMLLTALLHLWKRRMLLSIAAGTICYMLLIHFVF